MVFSLTISLLKVRNMQKEKNFKWVDLKFCNLTTFYGLMFSCFFSLFFFFILYNNFFKFPPFIISSCGSKSLKKWCYKRKSKPWT